MSNDPILSRLGFARKAGKLTLGFSKSKEACQNGKAKLIVVASDVSYKSEKEIRFFAGTSVPVVNLNATMDELSAALGMRAGIVAVTDQGFATSIAEQI
ncbi:MAG: 50S ribosomal protein L7 [Ruminococcaceae bacterium]|nr:50S ribosomal protein L7 [Oscillospiraceae bacterium]